jgi:transglutaminase-like putative cysteine protease
VIEFGPVLMQMRIPTLVFLMFSAVLAFVSDASAQAFSRADPPDWVDLPALPDPSPALLPLAQGGIYYLLGDRQIRWQGEVEDDYYRNAFLVTDRAGLEEAATLQYNYNPAFEEAILTRLQIVRGDQVIDLRDTLKEEIFRRETRLDEGIIDGTLTAVLQIPDLRVGDVLDAALILRGKAAVPGAPLGDTGRLEFGEPVGLERLLVHWPKDLDIHIGALPQGSGVTYSTRPGANGETIHEWRAANLAPVQIEDNTSYEADIRAKVRFSSAADWGTLSGTLSPYYTASYELPAEWQAKIDAIRKARATDAERATAALRLVQDDIRYVSLSVGAGGYFARLPQEVIGSGFGDCKDKALLLRVMLTALGIESYVALADIDAGYGLKLELPLLGAFDHAIVKAVIGGKTIWMDATATHEGGRVDTASPPDYGFALPLSGAAQTRLEPIPIDPATFWQVEVEENYDFRLMGVFFKVTSVFGGEAANDRRRHYAVTPASTQSDDYLRYYVDRYPGLQLLEPLVLVDDRDANQFTVKESYFLPQPALYKNGLREDFPFGTENFASNLPDVEIGTRASSLFSGAPSAHQHRVVVTGAPINFDTPAAKRITNDAFDFRFSAQEDGDGAMTMLWTYQRTGSVVAASKVPGIIRDARAVADEIWWTWNLVP